MKNILDEKQYERFEEMQKRRMKMALKKKMMRKGKEIQASK